MSTESVEKEQIQKMIMQFNKAQETGDVKGFLRFWHPEARRFGFGTNNELYVFSTEDILSQQLPGIQKAREENPDFTLSFLIERFKHIEIHPDRLIASVEVDWRMVSMGQVIGIHTTYYHLVKHEGNWVIVNITDRGKER
jgi:hypothetical protein